MSAARDPSMTRRKARAARGQRARGAVPRNRGPVTTLLAGVSLTGMRPAMTGEGGTDTAVFATYLEHFLLPALPAGTVIVVDKRRRAPTRPDPPAGHRRRLPVGVPAGLLAGSVPDRGGLQQDQDPGQGGRRAHPGSPGRRDRRRTGRRHRSRRRRLVRSRRLPHPTSYLKTAVRRLPHPLRCRQRGTVASAIRVPDLAPRSERFTSVYACSNRSGWSATCRRTAAIRRSSSSGTVLRSEAKRGVGMAAPRAQDLLDAGRAEATMR